MQPTQKAGGGTRGDKDDVDDLAKCLEKVSVSSADIYFGHPIEGVRYRKGLKGSRTTAHAPAAGGVPWHSDASASFPREFTQKTVRMFPQAVSVAPDAAGRAAPRVRWGADELSVEEWNAKVAAWDMQYPNVVNHDATPHESKDHRVQQTNKPETLLACWRSLPAMVPARYTGYAREALNHFKCDRYGNVICLRETAGGRANDGALTFFDVDHIFPWSRGGRSRLDNFEAVQCTANRHVKCDNLVQMLNPRDMNCGLR
jgi:hypothetical protein